MVGWFLNVLVNNLLLDYTADGFQDWRLTSLSAAAHETERGDHDFCLSRSHYTDTDQTSRERAATAGIGPRTSSPGFARSTDSATASPQHRKMIFMIVNSCFERIRAMVFRLSLLVLDVYVHDIQCLGRTTSSCCQHLNCGLLVPLIAF